WPLGHESHRRTCDLLLQGVLDHHPDATHVLLAEDDVDLHPDLPDVLPMAMSCDVVALMVNGTRFYPPWVKDFLARGERLPRPGGVVGLPVRPQGPSRRHAGPGLEV